MLCSTEVKHTKITLTFFQDQNLCPWKDWCPLNRGVPKERFYCMWFSFHFAGLSPLAYSQTHLPLIYVKPCVTGEVLNICTRERAKMLVWPWKRRCKHKLKPKHKHKILLACVFMLCIKSVSYYTTLSLHSLNIFSYGRVDWAPWEEIEHGSRLIPQIFTAWVGGPVRLTSLHWYENVWSENTLPLLIVAPRDFYPPAWVFLVSPEH